ncbi:MAG: pyridoxamine 5'-phosphate oxidase family protein [Gammaproteobacteria bacterium]
MTAASPWHTGERRLQQQAGVAERMATFGTKVIRDHLPEQHRAFYRQLPFLVIGAVDAGGSPWATVLEGEPGFLASPDAGTLRVDAQPVAGDPAVSGFSPGAGVGLLGIDLDSRRRNRLNGRITARDGGGFTVGVAQAFGNCPQYIQARTVSHPRRPGRPTTAPPERVTGLDDEARALIARADTFFVASYASTPGLGTERDSGNAVDVSHRGGRPGFIRVDGDVLTIPDFAGNLHFNTLGNLLVNPRAGLVFIDFDTGDLLQLSGTTELVLDGDEVRSFQGAQRLWRLRVQDRVRRPGALALRWSFGAFSPRLESTGTWPESRKELP